MSFSQTDLDLSNPGRFQFLKIKIGENMEYVVRQIDNKIELAELKVISYTETQGKI